MDREQEQIKGEGVPWKEIYHMDNERKQNWTEAEYTFHKMMEIYEMYGYKTVIVPKDALGNSKRFVKIGVFLNENAPSLK
ncbi:hypothetical protein [Massilibacteroides sp.]|uniref:hypothetical protein n=1 Tax=Massilibacteroides sp. TaxID=2034766 RepID=UPI00262DC067|nr:hypothetical protein [Massilibacteroides sp.]MDD4516152.1 hypothetical protein [Massilibacteroides sp.]